MVEPVASFHLVRQHAARAPLALARLGLDRRPLRRTPGLRFARLLGTGRGRTTSFSADLTRTAMFAVWDDDDALADFLRTSPVAARWRGGSEHYAVRLRLLAGGGRWRGVEPLAGLTPVGAGDRVGGVAAAGDRAGAGAGDRAGAGPVAVLTRADVRVRSWRPFLAAGGPVSDALQGAPGLLAVAGVGEAPLGRQATFSLWRDAEALDAFAYRDPAHVAVVRRTRAEGWYGEELFARFAPETVEGTWDGVDPLA